MVEYVIDAGPTMNKPDTTFSSTKLQLCVEIVTAHIYSRTLASTTFEAGVFAFGTGKTRNVLAAEDISETQYRNVEEVVGIGKPNLDSLKKLQGIRSGTGGTDGDILDAMIVGQYILQHHNKGF